ncbi:MAG: winged helix-turn-helix domain-containing protein [Acidobacteriota bacterium]|nr:winged helix-turn-helix domain-containing protein [Acidobacteriota bacterium]
METTGRSNQHVRFKSFELNLHTRELYNHGVKLKLQGHPIEVLAMLLERPGDLVSREDLQKRLWPQDTFVDFEHGLNSTINRLRETLGDHAETPRFIETLPRLGYRFIAPVEDAALADPSPPPPAHPPPANPSPPAARTSVPISKLLPRALATVLAAVAILLSLNALGLRDHLLERLLPAPAFRSIAVLPIQSLSGDPAQDDFANGMTAALITNLEGIGNLRVIARPSIMRYKGSKKPLPQIARQLKADVIMEGTVERWGDKVRITAQLMEGKTAHPLWAGSYERSFHDAPNLQSEVAEDIARRVKARLSPTETRRP